MPSAQGPKEGIAAQRCSNSPQKIGGCRVAPSTKPPHFPPRRETGRARLIVKSRIACRRPLYNTRAKGGYTGGKVRFPPVLHVHGFRQRTKHIPTGWRSTLCGVDPAGNADWEYYEYWEYCFGPTMCAASVSAKALPWQAISPCILPVLALFPEKNGKKQKNSKKSSKNTCLS